MELRLNDTDLALQCADADIDWLVKHQVSSGDYSED